MELLLLGRRCYITRENSEFLVSVILLRVKLTGMSLSLTPQCSGASSTAGDRTGRAKHPPLNNKQNLFRSNSRSCLDACSCTLHAQRLPCTYLFYEQFLVQIFLKLLVCACKV